MRVHTMTFDRESGWSGPFPESDSPTTLVLVFAAESYMTDHEPIAELVEAYPHSVIIGCSTAGEIHGVGVFDGSLSVAIAAFDHTTLRLATAPISARGSRAAGRAIADSLREDDLTGVFVLSEGLEVNGSDLVRGMTDVLDPCTTITGGLAGDGSRFERTWTIVDGKPATGQVSAVGLYGGHVRIGHGSKGGWDIFGPERVITRSHHNVLYELDGKPALALYKQYLGELASGLPATGLLFPLAVRDPNEDRQLVRTILSVNESDQSLTFAGDVPAGHRAQLMQANFDRVIGGAEDAARSAATQELEGDVLSIAVSCVGRRLVLGARTEEELEATMDVLPAGTHQVGYYSYGEISPYVGGTCDLHNQTMTMTTLSEIP